MRASKFIRNLSRIFRLKGRSFGKQHILYLIYTSSKIFIQT